MTPERYQLAKDIFLQACEVPAGQRPGFIEEAVQGDAELLAFVHELLANDDRPHTFVDATVPGAGARALAEAMRADAAAETPEEDPVPAAIGRYRIVRRIGSGGMGVVYEARQDTPQRSVALKVIRPGYANRTLLRRFQAEAHILGQLHHPGIAQIYDAGTADTGSGPQPFFAMELIDGLPLVQYATEHELSTRARLDMMVQICAGVEHAHRRGIIHRDLKPANILVTAEGGPKILDFGVARATDRDCQVTTIQTDVGQIIGTVSYMSPEQIAGDPAALDTRSDVYALGVIGYELLTGRLPLDVARKSLAEAARIITEQDPPPMSVTDRNLRGDLEAIFLQALEKDPVRRYQSAADLSRDILHYLRNEPISARPQTTMYQIRKLVARHKVPAALLALLIVGTSTAAVVATWQRNRARAAEQRASRELERALSAEQAAARERDRALNAEQAAARELERALKAEQSAARRFDQVRELAHEFIFEFHDAIQFLPGATPAREQLVTTALAYLDSLAQESAEDPALQFDLAIAYMSVAEIQGGFLVSNLGDAPGARRSFTKGLELLEALCAADPDNGDYQLSRARVLASLADLHFEARDLDSAQDLLNRSVRALALLHPDQQRAPSATRVRVGHGFRQGKIVAMRGDLEDACVQYQQAIQWAEEAGPSGRRDLAMVLSQYGQTLRDLGRLDDARVIHERANVVREELMQEHPNDTHLQRAHAVNIVAVGDVYRDQKQYDKALEQHRISLDIRRQLAERDPRNALFVNEVAVGLERVGEMLLATGHRSEALPLQLESLELRQRLVDMDPANHRLLREASVGHEKVANLLAENKDYEAAEKHYRTSLKLREDLVAAAQDSSEAHRDFSVTCFKMGALYAAAGSDDQFDRDKRTRDWQTARSWFQRALDGVRVMEERGMLAPSDAHIPKFLNDKIASCAEGLKALEPGDAPPAP